MIDIKETGFSIKNSRKKNSEKNAIKKKDAKPLIVYIVSAFGISSFDVQEKKRN